MVDYQETISGGCCASHFLVLLCLYPYILSRKPMRTHPVFPHTATGGTILCYLQRTFLALQSKAFCTVGNLVNFFTPCVANVSVLSCQISSTTQQDAIECRSIISSATGAYVAAHYAMLVSYFMTGAIVSSWTWNSTNLRRWRTVLGGRKLQ